MKLPFWASVLTLCSVIILCYLGNWQVARHAWKQGILAQLDAVYAQDASQIPLGADDFKDSEKNVGEFVPKRGYIIGHYLNDKAIRIFPKVFNKEVGAHLVTPFEIEGGGVVLVNRGWIPPERDMPEGKGIRTIAEQVKLVGMVRPAPSGNSFTPKNIPEKAQWYILNVAEIAKANALADVYPRVFYVEAAENTEALYPLAQAAHIEIANNHVQYAVFWFSMALVLIVVFILRFMKKSGVSRFTQDVDEMKDN